MAWNLQGKVAKCEHREYGYAQIQISKVGDSGSSVDALFDGLGEEMQVRADLRHLCSFSLTLFRSGCRTVTSFLNSPLTSMLSEELRQLLMLPSRTTLNRSTGYSSIQKSRIPLVERKSLGNSS